MFANATEVHATTVVTSRNNRRELQEAVLPRGPAPGGQCCSNGTRDTTVPTSTREQCFLFDPLRGSYHSPDRVGGVSWLKSSDHSQREREPVNMEVEESTALEAVTRQRLVETQQTEKTQCVL
jgi:hypothetical protein